jgi:hypothetical protein
MVVRVALRGLGWLAKALGKIFRDPLKFHEELLLIHVKAQRWPLC